MRHFHFDRIDSTNSWAKQNIALWDKAKVTLVSADLQTAGRGRLSRPWLSPAEGNIYASFCFFMEEGRQDVGQIAQLLCLAACLVLENWGFQPKVKWPNDLLIESQKLAGILCETVAYESQRAVICGLGMNVNMPAGLLRRLDRPAASLSVLTGSHIDQKSLLNDIALKFESMLLLFFEASFVPFFNDLIERSYYQPGDQVIISENRVSGQFVRLEENGSILLRLPDQQLKPFWTS